MFTLSLLSFSWKVQITFRTGTCYRPLTKCGAGEGGGGAGLPQSSPKTGVPALSPAQPRPGQEVPPAPAPVPRAPFLLTPTNSTQHGQDTPLAVKQEDFLVVEFIFCFYEHPCTGIFNSAIDFHCT